MSTSTRFDDSDPKSQALEEQCNGWKQRLMRRFDEGVEIWLLLCENLPYGVAEVFLIIVFYKILFVHDEDKDFQELVRMNWL